MSWGTVALTEILWTIFPAIGLVYSIRNGREVSHDLYSLRRVNGRNLLRYKMLRTIAYGHLRNELFRGTVLSTEIIAGLAAMTAPPANPNNPITAVQIIITMCFFFISATVVLGAVLDRRQRQVLREMVSAARTRPSDAHSETEPPQT